MLITPNPSIDILRTALEKKGYSFERFELSHHTFARFTAPNGSAWLTLGAHIGYPFISKAVAKVCDEKNIAYDFCAQEGLRIPRTVEVTGEPSDEYLATLLEAKPLIVKPHSSSLSNGLTLHIETVAQLREAIQTALRFSAVALVQEQVDGEEIRFTVVNGKVKAALLRQKPRLVGDGSATLEELLQRENAERAALKMQYVTYPQLSADLVTDTGHQLGDVLKKGETLELSRSTMIRTGASVYNVLADVDKSYIQLVENLVAKLGTRFVVVDMMLHDYTTPMTEKNYAFIEFNIAPVLKLFYSCRDGKQYDVVSDLVKLIDATLTGAKL